MDRRARLILALAALAVLACANAQDDDGARAYDSDSHDARPAPPPPAPSPPPPPPVSEPSEKKQTSPPPRRTAAPTQKHQLKPRGTLQSLRNLHTELRGKANKFLHSHSTHTAKSALVMGDVLLVMAGVQLQLSNTADLLTAAVAANRKDAKAEHHFEHSAHVHHEIEEKCAAGSIAILALLLVENVLGIWTQGPATFFSKTAQALDLFVVSTSLALEVVFEQLKGGPRVAAELWRFVRIVHGTGETVLHSPILAPYLGTGHGHGHH